MKYMVTTMTGAEGYKAMKFFLLRFAEWSECKDAHWLALALDRDPALMNDWQDSVKDMLYEREKIGNDELANVSENFPVFKECSCWLGRKPSEIVFRDSNNSKGE